jgi:hypothetical protein
MWWMTSFDSLSCCPTAWLSLSLCANALATAAACCQAVTVHLDAEQRDGIELLVTLVVFGGLIYMYGSAVIPTRSTDSPLRFEPLAAAVMAYSFYAVSALIADAPLPEFFREHLFDGFAPAALVALLVYAFPRMSPSRALPRIRLPLMILVLFFWAGALVFGLIAAAAVFSSGSNNYWLPLALCAGGGALLFPYAYVVLMSFDPEVDLWRRTNHRRKIIWFFTKRPPRHSVARMIEYTSPGLPLDSLLQTLKAEGLTIYVTPPRDLRSLARMEVARIEVRGLDTAITTAAERLRSEFPHTHFEVKNEDEDEDKQGGDQEGSGQPPSH